MIPAIALAIGLAIGFFSKLTVPPQWAPYSAVALLAASDSLLGGLRAVLEKSFNDRLFITGFIANTLLAASLALMGDRLGVNLYMAAVVAFGVRLFQNLATIRRILIKS